VSCDYKPIYLEYNPGIVASGLKIVSRSLYPGEKEVILFPISFSI